MKAQDIVQTLQQRLPFYSDAFSAQIALTSLVSLSNVVTVTTAVDHALSVGDKIHINNAVIPNPIVSLSQADGMANAETLNKHDLTFEKNLDQSVTISGAAEAGYNGDKTLLSVMAQSRNNFTFEVDELTISPDSGSPILEQTIAPRTVEGTQMGFNGFFAIQSVPTASTFTYNSMLPDVSAIGSPVLIGPGLRISRAASIDEIVNNYTQQLSESGRSGIRDLWAFVVLGDVSVSKSRHITTDNIATFALGDDPRQRQIEPFSVFVVIPTSKDLSGSIARDISQDLTPVFYRSLVGVKPATSLTESTWSKIAATGHGQALWNGSFYIHQFEFEGLADITLEDTALHTNHVPFECFNLNFFLTDNRDAPSVGGTFNL